MTNPFPTWAQLCATALAWAALSLQLYLSVELGVAKGMSMIGSVVTYLSFFTILTNILVALALSAPLVGANSRLGQFFMRPTVVTATAAYIAMVGIAYTLLLRQLWRPQGLQLVADVVLHDIMPVLFVLYWWRSAAMRPLRRTDVFRWALYPLCYLAYALIRGALVASYPYPFIDVDRLGYARVFLNAAGLLLAFLVIALLLIELNRIKKPLQPVLGGTQR
jgi:hypothetical protein